MWDFLLSLIIGGVSGFLAGKIMESRGGLVRNILLGLVGGVVGRALLGLFGFAATNLLSTIIVAVVGACVCIWLGRKLFH